VAPAVLALVIGCEYSLKRFLLQEALGGAVVVLVIALCALPLMRLFSLHLFREAMSLDQIMALLSRVSRFGHSWCLCN
jgi:hypothetical protein